MHIKLDENIGNRGADLLRDAGHDVATVKEQKLCSADDKKVIGICQKEKRCLVTLDVEFGNPLLFDAAKYSGIAVLRLPHKPTPQDMVRTIEKLIGSLSDKNISGRLWIVQIDRIREYQPDN